VIRGSGGSYSLYNVIITEGDTSRICLILEGGGCLDFGSCGSSSSRRRLALWK
jgi:hypothetical protein